MIGFAGHLRVQAGLQENGRTVLTRQSFRAPFHISKPYWDGDASLLHVQVVNPTAGIFSGDRMESDIAAERGASLLVTTPSASRVFRMIDGRAEAVQRFLVAENGWLEVAPEPLVPHRGSRFRQITEIGIDPGGGLFYVDQLIPGRIGHGETWAWTELSLELSVRLGGELILRERFAHSGSELRSMADFHGSGPTACFANAILVPNTPNATAAWTRPIMALNRDGVRIGVSALRQAGWNLKVVAPDPLSLRATVAAVRAELAGSFPHLGWKQRKL